MIVKNQLKVLADHIELIIYFPPQRVKMDNNIKNETISENWKSHQHTSTQQQLKMGFVYEMHKSIVH